MKKGLLIILPLVSILFSCGEQPQETFSINLIESSNGTLTCDKNKVFGGEFATFTCYPDDGYVLYSLSINEEPVEVTGNIYTLFDIRNDINAKAIFVDAPIKVTFLDADGNVAYYRYAYKEENVEYLGKEPTKIGKAGEFYTFKGWSLSEDGPIITSFSFSESTMLYPIFDLVAYHATMKENLKLVALRKGDIDLETDCPEDVLKTALVSEDPTIATVTSDGIVSAVGVGKTNINFVIGESILASCEVEVEATDNAIAQYVYGNGYVTYNNGVGHLYSSQANIMTDEVTTFNSLYVDFSVDFVFHHDLTSADNFGLQFNKETTSSGNVSKAFQFGCYAGESGNVYLKVNGTAKLVGSYLIEKEKLYNFRVVTSPSGVSGSPINAKCYINGDLIFDSNRGNLGSATNYCGLRYAGSSSFISFVNLVVKENNV